MLFLYDWEGEAYDFGDALARLTKWEEGAEITLSHWARQKMLFGPQTRSRQFAS